MKIKVLFTPQALMNIKTVLESVYKLIQSEPQLPPVYFVYFIHEKNIRFLVDSEISPIVISIGPQMINLNQLSVKLKQDKSIVYTKFQNTQIFFQNMINTLQKQDTSGLELSFKNQMLDKVQRTFIQLRLKNNTTFVSRIMVELPRYDKYEIRYHKWVCGVQKVKTFAEISIFTQELCNIMRYLIKTKLSSDKKLAICLNMSQKYYTGRATDQHCKVNVVGEFKTVLNDLPEGQTWLQYHINVNDIKIVHEVLRKSKELKVTITKQYKFVFAFLKDQLYTCHLDMSNWVRYVRNEQNRHEGITKIEQVQEGGMKWN